MNAQQKSLVEWLGKLPVETVSDKVWDAALLPDLSVVVEIYNKAAGCKAISMTMMAAGRRVIVVNHHQKPDIDAIINAPDWDNIRDTLTKIPLGKEVQLAIPVSHVGRLRYIASRTSVEGCRFSVSVVDGKVFVSCHDGAKPNLRSYITAKAKECQQSGKADIDCDIAQARVYLSHENFTLPESQKMRISNVDGKLVITPKHPHLFVTNEHPI